MFPYTLREPKSPVTYYTLSFVAIILLEQLGDDN